MESLESIFITAHRQLRPRTPLPDIKIEFFPFAGLNHTARLSEGRLIIRVSDVFTDAPFEVYQSLALILLAKLYRKKVDSSHHNTYRAFILKNEIQERARAVRSERGRISRQRGSRGRHIDLDEVFNRLNGSYFAGSINRPQLSWSARRSRYVLGRYDVTHNTIFISKFFDSPNVPQYVVEYVMFHEMLHVKHQSRVQHSRVIVHTSEFKNEERNFVLYREAKLWLEGISAGAR
jgi:hypothetical protein